MPAVPLKTDTVLGPCTLQLVSDGAVNVISSKANSSTHQLYMMSYGDRQSSLLMVPRNGDKSQAFIVKPVTSDSLGVGGDQPSLPQYRASNTVVCSSAQTKQNFVQTNSNISMHPISTSVPEVMYTTAIGPRFSVNNPVPVTIPPSSSITMLLNQSPRYPAPCAGTMVSLANPSVLAPPPLGVQQPTVSGVSTRFASMPILLNPLVRPRLNTPDQSIALSNQPTMVPIIPLHEKTIMTDTNRIPVQATATDLVNLVPVSNSLPGLNPYLTSNSVMVSSQSLKLSTAASGTPAPLSTGSSTITPATTNTSKKITATPKAIGNNPVRFRINSEPTMSSTCLLNSEGSLNINNPFPMFVFSHDAAYKLKPAALIKTQTTTASIYKSTDNIQPLITKTTSVTTVTPTISPIVVERRMFPQHSANCVVTMSMPASYLGNVLQSSRNTNTAAVVTSGGVLPPPCFTTNPSITVTQLLNSTAKSVQSSSVIQSLMDIHNAPTVQLPASTSFVGTTSTDTVPVSVVTSTPTGLIAQPNTAAYEKFRSTQNLASQVLQKNKVLLKKKPSERHKLPSKMTNVQKQKKREDHVYNSEQLLRIESVCSLSSQVEVLGNSGSDEILSSCPSVSDNEGDFTPLRPKDAHLCQRIGTSTHSILHDMKPCMVILQRVKTDAKRKWYSAQDVLRNMRTNKKHCTKKCKARFLHNMYHKDTTNKRATKPVKVCQMNINVSKNTHVSASSIAPRPISVSAPVTITSVVPANKPTYNLVKPPTVPRTSQTHVTNLNKSINSVPILVQKNAPPTPIILQNRKLHPHYQSPMSHGITNPEVFNNLNIETPIGQSVLDIQCGPIPINAKNQSTSAQTHRFYLMKAGGKTLLIPSTSAMVMPRAIVTNNANIQYVLNAAPSNAPINQQPRVCSTMTLPAAPSSAPINQPARVCRIVTAPATPTSVPSSAQVCPIVTASPPMVVGGAASKRNISNLVMHSSVPRLPMQTNNNQLVEQNNFVAHDPNVRIKTEPTTFGYGADKRSTPSPPVLVKEEPTGRGYCDELTPAGSKRGHAQHTVDNPSNKRKKAFSEALVDDYQAEFTDIQRSAFELGKRKGGDRVHYEKIMDSSTFTTPPTTTPITTSTATVPLTIAPITASTGSSGETDASDTNSIVFTRGVTNHGDKIMRLKERLKQQMEAVEKVRLKHIGSTTVD